MTKFLKPFCTICACGLFIALASGTQWGTPACGYVATITLLIALLAGALAVDFC